jgi:hypothetical protein
LPTDSPTPEPSPTPDVAATQSAKSTEAASSVLSELDKYLGESGVPYKEGHLLWQQQEPFSIILSGPSDDIQGIEDGPTAGNFVFKSEVTWEATGILICGLAFRSESNLEDGRQYQFVFLRFSGLPAWALEVHEFGRYKNSPSDSRTSAVIDLDNGATNTVMIVAQDDSFEIYINRSRQGKFFDYSNQRTEGEFGFLGYQDSGKGNCEFNNSWVWSLD